MKRTYLQILENLPVFLWVLLLTSGCESSKSPSSRGPTMSIEEVGTAIARNEKARIMEAIQRNPNLIRETDQYGDSLLNLAVEGDHRELAETFLKAGADVHFKGGRVGNPLIYSVYHGSPEMVRLLIDYGADIEEQVGEEGPALIDAASAGRLAIVEILLVHPVLA
jgi:uncharacterized protein